MNGFVPVKVSGGLGRRHAGHSQGWHIQSILIDGMRALQLG